MSVRYPPKNNVPPPSRTNRNRRAARIVKYEEPPRSFTRRALRRVFSPFVVIPLVFLTCILIGVLGYYYTVFSGRIDRLLRGEVFTRSAGIYAAPKTLRVGANLTTDDVTAMLRRANYVEQGQQADGARGRFSTKNGNLEIEPGTDSLIDNHKQFPRLRVTFARGG